MDAIAQALADPAVRGGYLMACFAVLILPIVALSVWFHRRIGKNAGGRQLMERQRGARTWARGSLADAAYNAGDGLSIMRDVHAGRYGQQTKALMGRVYWFVAAWIALNCRCVRRFDLGRRGQSLDRIRPFLTHGVAAR